MRKKTTQDRIDEILELMDQKQSERVERARKKEKAMWARINRHKEWQKKRESKK